MSLDTRTAQTTLENLIRDAILYALGVRLPQVASIAALRAVGTAGQSGSSMLKDDDLITTLIGGTITGWRWSRESTATDDGATVVQPNDVTSGSPGRWLAYSSKLRFATTVGGNSTTLDQITAGPVQRVIVLDKPLSKDEEVALVNGDVPAVIIESHGDDPKDATLNVGHRWISEYAFTVTVISQNLRDYRQAAQGSSTDSALGANDLDGFIKALLSGTTLNAAFTNDQPIQNVKIGHAENRYSDFGQRRVWRIRDYSFQVTEENLAAPNDAGVITDVYVQAQLVSQAATPVPPVTNPPTATVPPAYDPNNYLAGGCAPTVGGALTQSLSAGSAVIAGASVSYAGGSVTFAAYSDTYRDLTADGVMHLLAVPMGGDAPAVTAGALRIGFTSTNGSQVVGDAILAQTQAPLGPNFDFQV